jgi:glutamine synthetase
MYRIGHQNPEWPGRIRTRLRCNRILKPPAAHQGLPESVDQALAALRQSQVISAAVGPMLYDAFTAVRAAEAETYKDKDPELIAAAHRWRY